MPRSQHHPSPEERDERVKLDLPPDQAIRLLMETGPHPESETDDADWENEGGATEDGPQEAGNLPEDEDPSEG